MVTGATDTAEIIHFPQQWAGRKGITKPVSIPMHWRSEDVALYNMRTHEIIESPGIADRVKPNAPKADPTFDWNKKLRYGR